MPFGLGLPELIIILVVLILLFGASRIGELGGALGKGLREFRTAVKDEDLGKEKKDNPEAKGQA